MKPSYFDELRRDVNHLLTCIDLVEKDGALRWATNLREVARIAHSISQRAKMYEDRERKMNWRPAGKAEKKKASSREAKTPEAFGSV